MNVCDLGGETYSAQTWPGLNQEICLYLDGVWHTYTPMPPEPIPVEVITNLFTQFLAFDLSTFEIIVGGSLVAYALGHATGAIISIMRRT